MEARSRRALAVGTVVAVVFVASCTGSTSSSGPEDQAPSVPAELAELPGSLLVLDGTGSLVTMSPEGRDRTTLAIAEPGSLQVFQAAWAPDGSKVAWAQVDVREGSAVPRLITTGPTGEERVETTVDLVPFYLSWDPTSRHVAYLGNGADSIQLGVVEDAGTGAAVADPLDEGAPYYFSWSPDGDRLLVHVGDDRLEELTLAGEGSPIDDRPGVFQAPAWSPDGSSQVFVRRFRGLRQRIVVAETGRGRSRDLAIAEGAIFMVLSPDGTRLAYQALSPDEFDLYDRDVAARATDVGVSVIDLLTGKIDRITTDLAHAWFWSPDGSSLAIFEPVYTEEDSIPFRWTIWDGASSFRTAEISPGLELLDSFTPFFSQYAQSSTIWSPDGSAIAFPVDTPAGSSIMVQPAREGAQAHTVSDGSFVVWSPS